jgi:pyridoxine 5-phosphate synthase
MTKLSVNINKFATLRNARGHNNPNVLQIAIDVQKFGADGVTVHPRPDERHIRYADVLAIKDIITTEFNIEGNCTETKFVDLVLQAQPTQVTLVPDAQGQLTSNHGWDTITHQAYLTQMITLFKNAGIRTSIFCDANIEMVKAAKDTGTDRIELYTEQFAIAYTESKCTSKVGKLILDSFIQAATTAQTLGLQLNAGHDLDAQNLQFFLRQVPYISEVSIGHALVCDALYLGLENTIQLYKRQCANTIMG